MRPVRSMLFVPGHKADWIVKAVRSPADAVIIDLEDAVPAADKQLARDNAREAVERFGHDRTLVIRVNALDTPHFGEDIRATAVTGLAGYLLPKLTSRDDVVRFDAVITLAELERGAPRGSIEVIPSFETASSIDAVEAIVRAPRVGAVMAAAARDADISREVGFTWTAEGLETLYLRSRIVVAARAAGIRTIVLGLWQDIRDLEGLRAFATANAGLGYTGQVLIHPSHAEVVNEAYGLPPARATYYRRLIAAFEEGEAAGHGAVLFEGDHIDLAHANHAREVLALDGRDD